MAHTMTPAEYREFLAAGTRTLKLATVGPDGQPHVAPVWFVLDGETVVFTTGASTVKGKNLLRDPRVAMSVDDETPPYAFVLITGTAEAIHGAPDLREWATRIAARYMGADRAVEYGNRNGVPGELLVRVTPTRIIGQSAVSD